MNKMAVDRSVRIIVKHWMPKMLIAVLMFQEYGCVQKILTQNKPLDAKTSVSPTIYIVNLIEQNIELLHEYKEMTDTKIIVLLSVD